MTAACTTGTPDTAVNIPAQQGGGHPARPFWALLVSSFISRMGNSFAFLALPWFVLATTDSPARASIVATAGLVPIAIAGVAGGILVDRLGDRRMAIISDLASAFPTAAIPLLYATVGLPFWVLVALVVLGALLDTPGSAARSSLQPDLALAAGLPLERANALEAITRRLSTTIGAPLAGLLVAMTGASAVLWFNAASFIISAIIVALYVPSSLGRTAVAADTSQTDTPRSSALSEAVEGLRFIWNDALLRGIVLTMAVGGLLAEPVYAVILPVFARDVYGNALDLGILFAALGGGSILGAAAVAWRGQFFSRRTTILIAFTVRALTFWVLLLQPHLLIVAGSIVLNAAIFEPSNPMITTVMQERIPPALRGRVFGAITSLAIVTMPVGMLFYGWVLSSFGLMTGLWILASVNLLVPIGLYLWPTARLLDDPTPRPLTTATSAPGSHA